MSTKFIATIRDMHNFQIVFELSHHHIEVSLQSNSCLAQVVNLLMQHPCHTFFART